MAEQETKKMQDKAHEGFQQATRAVSETSEQAVAGFGESFRALAETSNALASGFQEASREWVAIAQNRLKANLDGINKLMSCKTLQDAITTQGELMRFNVEQFLEDSRRLADLSTKTMNKVAERATDQTRRAA